MIGWGSISLTSSSMIGIFTSDVNKSFLYSITVLAIYRVDK